MEKLILATTYYDIESHTDYKAFYYKSKEDFIKDAKANYPKGVEVSNSRTITFESRKELHDLDFNLLTPDEWFEELL